MDSRRVKLTHTKKEPIMKKSPTSDKKEKRVQQPEPDFIAYHPDGRFWNEAHMSTSGRGVPVDGKGGGMVLVAMQEGSFMVAGHEWKARLSWRCPHNLLGWACKKCLQGIELRSLL